MRPLRLLLMATVTTGLFTNTSKAICDAILEARPNIGARLFRGWAQVRRGEYGNNAEQDFTHVIDNMEVSEGQEALLGGFVYRLRARCYEGQAEWILCLEDLKKALSLYEADADVAADADALAELRDQQHRVKRKQAGEFDDSDVRPESAAPLSNRHEILDALVAGELEQALKLCEARIDDINVRFCRGLAKDFRGRRAWKNDNKEAAEKDFAEAIADYSDVIEDASSHFLSRAYVRRAMLLIALEQFEDTLAGLDELVERQLLNAEDKSLHISAGLNRGLANLRLLEYEEAGKAFVAVLELDPNNLRALDGNGQVDLYTQKRSDALEKFSKRD